MPESKKREERKQEEKISVLAPFAEKPAISCCVSCWGNEVPEEFTFWGGIPPRLPAVFQILGAKKGAPLFLGLPSWALQPARSRFGKGSLRDPLPSGYFGSAPLNPGRFKGCILSYFIFRVAFYLTLSLSFWVSEPGMGKPVRKGQVLGNNMGTISEQVGFG